MRIEMKWFLGLGGLLVCLFFLPTTDAKGEEKVLVTVLTASNKGSDFNLDNDKYRDKLIRLFSYSAYNQEDQKIVSLAKTDPQILKLIEDYELVLVLQEESKGRIMLRALIRKRELQYLNTALSIMKGGVVFVGGPNTDKGALILVLERV